MILPRPLVRLAVAAFAAACMAAASDPSERLADPGQEARARAIFKDVRCLVCQNESIDDSSAELAADLRRIVREQVAAGRSDQEVRDFLTARYGEFVLLKPSFSVGNAVLWLAPFGVVGAGVLLLVSRLRSRPEEAELSEVEASRLDDLTRGDEA